MDGVGLYNGITKIKKTLPQDISIKMVTKRISLLLADV